MQLGQVDPSHQRLMQLGQVDPSKVTIKGCLIKTNNLLRTGELLGGSDALSYSLVQQESNVWLQVTLAPVYLDLLTALMLHCWASTQTKLSAL